MDNQEPCEQKLAGNALPDRLPTSLSDMFPPGTAYFYGFPLGQDSGFYNAPAPAADEELDAMHTTVCAGANVRPVIFSNTVSDRYWEMLQDILQIPMLTAQNRNIVLPASISASLMGAPRNEAIKRALADLIGNGRLVMAQPYLDGRLADKYLINPSLTAWFNDKENIGSFVPPEYCVPEYARAENGGRFAEIDAKTLPFPCVVKLAASAAGEGVRICPSAAAFKKAQTEFKTFHVAIIVQKYIADKKDLDFKFAVYADPKKNCSVFGCSSPINGHDGGYFGGIIAGGQQQANAGIRQTLLLKVLPFFQEKGWFGVGGVDVLLDQENGRFYFNDFNCRMTATMPQTFQKNAGLFGQKSILVFTGEFAGDLKQFRKNVAPIGRHGGGEHILNVVALNEGKNIIRLHGGVLFDQQESLHENIARLQGSGISSGMFEQSL